MSERAKLKDIFSAVPDLSDPVWETPVDSVSPEDGGLSVTLAPGARVSAEALSAAEAAVCRAYGVARVRLRTAAPVEKDEEEAPPFFTDDDAPPEGQAFADSDEPSDVSAADETEDTGRDAQILSVLRQVFSKKHPSAAPCLREAELSLSGSVLTLRAAEQWHLTRLSQLEKVLGEEASALLERPVQVRVTGESNGSSADDFARSREETLSKLRQEYRPAQTAPTQQQKPQQRRSFTRQRDPNAAVFRPKDEDDVIYGKPFSREMIRLGDVNLDSGKITVQGEIFRVEFKKLNGRGKTVVNFEFSDGTGSIRASKVLPDEEAAPLESHIKKGAYVIVQGLAHYDTYLQDISLNFSAIIKGKKPVRQDKADEKRVELHLHTTMSSMDGLCNPDKTLKLAASMGHKAVAITDHGVVQAFPDTMKAQADLKKAGKEIKVLYGVEAYCVDDLGRSNAVKGESDALLTDEIVVFDTETTGLSAVNCEIIEIAAFLVSGGEIRDSFHCYVKPTQPIPPRITELTGISNDTVRDARPIEEELPRFLEFCGGRPLCAHNAAFDMGFLAAACEKLGLNCPTCSIDTVTIARALLPNLNKHKLNNIADAMGLRFQHHRADDDARVLAEIFLRFIPMLEEKCGITKLSEINAALAALSTGTGADKKLKSWHLIILVKNRPGLIALYKLISDAHLKHFNRRPIIPMSELAANRENLILGSACVAGELFSAVVDGRPWGELMELASFYDYLEIQPLDNNRFLIDREMAKDEEQLREFNRTVLRLGDALHKPVCATGDVHFLEPEDGIYREILQAGMGFKDAEERAPLYFRTTDEMLREFSYLGAKRAHEVVVENPNAIADQIEDIEPVLSGSYPPSIEHSAEDLQEICWKKAKELYEEDGKLPDIVADRINAELIPIVNNGFDVMYMSAQKLVARSNELGYIVGSRGSVGSSFVAYLSGITEVNALQPHYRCPKCRHSVWDNDPIYQTGVDMPDKVCPKCGTKMVKDGFNIPFATFLGFNADKTPDIDLNFSGECQSQIHRYTVDLFGNGQVFKAGTIGTIQEKTAYGFVRKYLEERGKTANGAEIDRLVTGCTGVKRTTGQHPGGLIIVPNGRSIYEFTPVQHPADDPDSDIITTHFDFHSIHDNLLKLDELGHDVPTIIRHLQDLTGVDPRDVPLDDSETMRVFTDISPLGIETDDILEQPGSAGVPEFGTKNARSMLMETRPTTLEGLIRISGLSHGTDVWRNNAQDVINAGLATINEVISVRDDITTKLIAMGLDKKLSFTISESVRKGKGLKPEWEEEMKAHGLPDWYIDSCKKIKYMFPRGHAVAYTLMSFRIAWYKVHHPLAYYSVYFGNRLDSFDCATILMGDDAVCRKYREYKNSPKRTAVEDDVMITLEIAHEFYKRGFRFLPMDVYRSDPKAFLPEDNALRPPFMALSGVGEAAAVSIAQEREKEPFLSQEDISVRCGKASTAVVQSLKEVGALNGLPESNQLDLFGAF